MRRDSVCRTLRGRDAEEELQGRTCRVSCKANAGAETQHGYSPNAGVESPHECIPNAGRNKTRCSENKNAGKSLRSKGLSWSLFVSERVAEPNGRVRTSALPACAAE